MGVLSRLSVSKKFVVAAVIFAVGVCFGMPTYNPNNGHYYEVVWSASGVTWQQAKELAEQRSYMGSQGYLATITSAEENAWLAANFSDLKSTWVGGYQDHNAPDYSEPAGGWRWVTGEPWSYTNWGYIEPNNYWPEGEDYLAIWTAYAPTGYGWNDFSGHGGLPIAYLVEYPVQIPVPGAFVLAAIGVSFTAVLKKKVSL